MKKLHLLCFLLLNLISFVAFAQSPQKFKYKAIARDAQGQLLTNKAVEIRFSIFNGSALGVLVYQESHKVTTDEIGQFAVDLGAGAVVSGGRFDQIDWSNGEKHLKIDFNAGTGFVSMGTTQLVSVPYALYAKQAESAKNLVGANDISNTNELQTLSLNKDTLVLSQNGGKVQLGQFVKDSLKTAIKDPSIGLQQVVDPFISAYLQKNTVTDADSDPINEIQELRLVNRTLQLVRQKDNVVTNEVVIPVTFLSGIPGPQGPAGAAAPVQTITFDATTKQLSLSSSGTVDLSSLADFSSASISFVTATNNLTLNFGTASSTVNLNSLTGAAGTAAGLAGNGLVVNGTTLDINVDNTSLELNTDILRVKDLGITNAKLDKATIPLSGFATAAAPINLGNQVINNLANPTLAQDAANKNYVDLGFTSLGTAFVKTDGTTPLTNNWNVGNFGLSGLTFLTTNNLQLQSGVSVNFISTTVNTSATD